MLTQHIALVSDTDAVSLAELTRVSAALQRQVTRDLGPTWGVSATVDAFASLEDVPIGYWPVVVCGEPLGAEGGVHLDRDGQPHARVEASLAWSLDASSATLAMLVDPFGSRTALGASPRGDRAPAEVLVEVCAPCASVVCAYVINDVIVSDFCTPAFFGVAPEARASRYSWNGSVMAPLSVLPGGHLTWHEPDDDAWWVRSHYGENPIDTRLGQPLGGSSVRGLVRECAPERPPLRKLPLALAAQLRMQREHALHAATVRAARLRGRLLERQMSGPVLLAAGEVTSEAVAVKIPEATAAPVPEAVAAPVPAALAVQVPAALPSPASPGLDAPPPRTAPSQPARAASSPPSLPPSLRPSLGEAGTVSIAPSERSSAIGARRADVPEPVRARLWLAAGVALALGGIVAFLLDGRASREPARRVPAAAPALPTVVDARATATAEPTPHEVVTNRVSAVDAPPGSASVASPPSGSREGVRHERAAPTARKARVRARATAAPRVAIATPTPSSAPTLAPPTATPPVVTVARSKTSGLADLLDTRE